MKYSKLVWTMAAAGLLAGCTSALNQRIAAHENTWQGLSEQDRQRLQRGYVHDGDTEEMVLIALGAPDKVLPITSLAGQKQTVWLYDLFEVENSNYSPFDPASAPPHYSNREKSVIFHDGIMVDQRNIAPEDLAKLPKLRADITAERMVTRLDSLVTLTPEQNVNAYRIFAKANEELFVFDLNERPMKGAPIRVKMRADIRALLTAKQQAKYDVAPQYSGGGSMKRP